MQYKVIKHPKTPKTYKELVKNDNQEMSDFPKFLYNKISMLPKYPKASAMYIKNPTFPFIL